MNHKPWRSKKEQFNEDAQKTFSRIMLYCLKFLEDKDLDSQEVKDQLKSSNTHWVDYCHRNNIKKDLHGMFMIEINKIVAEVKAELTKKGLDVSAPIMKVNKK